MSSSFERPSYRPHPDSTDGTITLRIHNTNTNKILHSRFYVREGKSDLLNGPDQTSIDGVSGQASRILLDFVKPAGSKTGRLLPTGNAVDVVDGYHVSLVDAANPCVFVSGDELGLSTLQRPEVLRADERLIKILEHLRRSAGVVMGLADTPEKVTVVALPLMR